MGLLRFSISVDEELVKAFDARNRRRGYENRSEAVRDLVRECLVAEEWERGRDQAVGVVSLVFDHHRRELPKRLTEAQHRHHDLVVAATHVHLDHDNCLEVLILRGPAANVRRLAEELTAARGIKHGKLFLTTTGKKLT